MFNKYEDRIEYLENQIEYHKQNFDSVSEVNDKFCAEIRDLKYALEVLERQTVYWNDHDDPRGSCRIHTSMLSGKAYRIALEESTTPANIVLALILNHLNLKLSKPDNKMQLVARDTEKTKRRSVLKNSVSWL